MKKLLLLYVLLFISCGRNNEEQMFYDFMDDAMIKINNMSAIDLDLKIISFEKVGVIIAKDSIDILNKQLSPLHKVLEEDSLFIEIKLKEINTHELDKSEKEFKKSKTRSSSMALIYQEIIDSNQNLIDLYQKGIDRKKDNFDERKLSHKNMSLRLDELKLDTGQIISTKYAVTYSLYFPDTQFTNTYRVISYTNEDNSKFLFNISR